MANEVAPLSRRPVLTDEELNQSLDLKLNVFRNAGLRLKDLTIEDFLAINLTFEDASKALRFLESFINQQILLPLISQAEHYAVLLAKASLDAQDLWRLVNWLKTSQGAAAIRKVQTERKLLKKSTTQRSAKDVAFMRLLSQENVDLAAATKEIQSEVDAGILAHNEAIQKLKEKGERRIRKAREEYSAAANFPDPTVDKLRDLCWIQYLDKCTAEGKTPARKTNENLRKITEEYRQEVSQNVVMEYCDDEGVRQHLTEYGDKKIKHLKTHKRKREVERFVISLRPQLARHLFRYPLPNRLQMMKAIPLGPVSQNPELQVCWRLSEEKGMRILRRRNVLGVRRRAKLPRELELGGSPVSRLLQNGRVTVVRSIGALPRLMIPVSRSVWEAGVRRIIGGGELLDWKDANNMYRGGGNIFDAIRILAHADCSSPFTTLRSVLSLERAREVLCLKGGFEVPDGPAAVLMKNFNDDATAGPTLRAYGVKRKYGLKEAIEQFVWSWYDRVGNGEFEVDRLPFLLSRIGYRSKLLEAGAAFEKIAKDEPIGRAVMMLDAVEQSFNSPLYNVLCPLLVKLHKDENSGWRNFLIRASSDWGHLWKEVKAAKCIVELDWSKFDRERPDDDISFFIDIICSCFNPKSEREKRLLSGYRRMLQVSLLHKFLMLDDGGCFQFRGMIPSGSLWTGVAGTGLNILYITCALERLGFDKALFSPKCAGDDNLTLFKRKVKKAELSKLRITLNEMFRAGIKDEDFFIHYPPFHVTTEQAVFPPDVDLKLGTSRVLDKADWVRFEGELDINEREGKSHRWRYNFFKKPKFLANFFLPDGRCIRPAKDNLEKLLWPEGLHKDIEDYEAALMSMVVDNPWNHHNVNHLMHRYCIVQQIKRQSFDLPAEDILVLAGLKEVVNGAVAFPMIGYWRRQEAKVEMEQVPELRPYLQVFNSFVSNVSTLYSRAAQGGIDAWQFMEIIRGERSLGSGQYGNDITAWCSFLGAHPFSRELRPARRYRVESSKVYPSEDAAAGFRRMVTALEVFCLTGNVKGGREFANFVGNLLYGQVHVPVPA
ncbi:polyprotein [Ophrys amalgavirus 1]|nr:polyprotein [Ophrys amalgavirus 1]DAZ91035.1 TPA_asm: fusion protein [Ophrys fusca amalgavirus 1]